MAPIAQESYQNFQSSSDSQKPTEKSASLPILIERISSAALPWESFLRNNSAERERVYFATLGTKEAAVFDVQRENIVSLLPAFLLTELREAFQIGFLLFLPFLVVDLVVTNLLVGLGMTMLTPTSVSLPLKLLLFYLADGWFLLSKSLVEGYLR